MSFVRGCTFLINYFAIKDLLKCWDRYQLIAEICRSEKLLLRFQHSSFLIFEWSERVWFLMKPNSYFHQGKMVKDYFLVNCLKINWKWLPQKATMKFVAKILFYFRRLEARFFSSPFLDFRMDVHYPDQGCVGQTCVVKTVSCYHWDFVLLRIEQVDFCLASIAWSQWMKVG